MQRLEIIIVAFMYLWLANGPPALAAGPTKLSENIQYELLGHWDAQRLNTILEVDTPKFSGLAVKYKAARNGARLYRVTYSSVVPEQNNRPIKATGLIAIPDISSASLPMVSYQHGTVFGKHEVPSQPENSSETLLMIAQFAGRGYVVIGADYFGMGTTDEPEGYGVKASHQQATFDLLTASRAILAHFNTSSNQLFLGGWSQGGFVTMALLEKLEYLGIKVNAAGTAAGPVDISLLLRGFLQYPRPNDASWISTLYILSAFSFETYYRVPGLARSLFQDDRYDLARKVYLRETYDLKELDLDLTKLIRKQYFDPAYFASSPYGRIAEQTTAYRWAIATPVRNYYGENDEVISVGLARLAMNYQHAAGRGNHNVQALTTGPTNHRGTFALAVSEWQTWFDSMAAIP